MISDVAAGRMKKVKLHLKIDTGMGRIGCRDDEAVSLAENISGLENIELEGVFSHFPAADEPGSDFTTGQIKKFEDIIKKIEKAGVDIKYRHMANSAAIFNYRNSIFNLARPGIAAYGYRPSRDFNPDMGLVPSMTFKSYIVFHKRVKAGTPLSYGLTYKTDADSNIATVPVGYGDGYNRLLSNRGRVIIRDRIYPVVGRVCMDQILINLGNDEYPIGEEVILFGRKDITVETVAEMTGTIPYEVTCSISKRVRRVYK
jgi:alanine racemase